jgi:hypothetical protein
MAKAYKNVYTIFEKVKKGELESNSPRLFEKIQYNLRNEVIKPHLHYIDEKALRKSVSKHIYDGANHSKIVSIAQQMNKKLPAPQELQKQMHDIYEKFPKEIINDVFNMFYHNVENMEFEQRTAQNKFRYKVIEKSNNPVLKVMSNNSHLKSMIFSRSFIQYYMMMLAMLEQEDKQSFDDLMNQLKQQAGGEKGDGNSSSQQNNSGDGSENQNDNQNDKDSENQDDQDQKNDADNGNSGNDNSSQNKQSGKGSSSESLQNHLESLLKKFEDSKVNNKILDEVMNNAKQTVNMLDQIMSAEEMEKAWEAISESNSKNTDKALARTDINTLNKIEQELQKINVNMSNVKSKIKDLLDKSVSYFSAKDTPVYENIFDAESMHGLMDYELLHPKLRKVFMEDIMVKDTKKIGKIDIYVDLSGSMSSSSGVRDEHGYMISKKLFAKSFAYKMKQLNMLNHVFSFENHVTYEGTEIIDIVSMNGSGGTDLNRVIEKIEQNKRNAIIITDAEDRCHRYSPYAYFIGVQGSDFSYFSTKTLEEYHLNNQLCVFDGTRVYNVNQSGYVIN